MANKSEHIQKGSRTTLLICRIVSYVFLGFVTLLSLFSFILLLINSSRSNSQLTLGFSLLPGGSFFNNLSTAWNDRSLFFLPQGLLNSFIIASATCVLTTYFSAMTAYGICVYDFKGRNVINKVIIGIMMIPAQVSALGFVDIINNIGLTNTYWPLIIPGIAAPAVYFYMKQYIDSTLPLEIVEAARVDGSNEFRTFNLVSLPILKPAMAVQMIFSFVGSWNNFFTPMLLLSDRNKITLPIMLAYLRQDMGSQRQDLGERYMFILLSILPVVVVYFILSKYIVGGVTLGSVKG